MPLTRRFAPSVVFLSALIVFAAAPAARAAADGAKTYRIKFVRPTRAGDRYQYTADGAMLQKARSTIGGQPGTQTEGGFGVHLEGTVEVLDVNKSGEEA